MVALRLWRPLFTYLDAVGVRSDSHGSLSALASLSTSSASLNVIVCEIALDTALAYCALVSLTHIPGVSNTVADACRESIRRIRSRGQKSWTPLSAANPRSAMVRFTSLGLPLLLRSLRVTHTRSIQTGDSASQLKSGAPRPKKGGT